MSGSRLLLVLFPRTLSAKDTRFGLVIGILLCLVLLVIGSDEIVAVV